MTIDPGEAVDTINARFGRHPRTRALHAKGSWLRGHFTATPEARELCRAAHLQGQEVPVLARLSNGSGDPNSKDFEPDIRGLAVKFELPDGSRTDLVAQTLPRFISGSPDDFIEFIRATTGRGAAWRLPRFFATHPHALRALPGTPRLLRPLESFARCRFYTLHAVRWEAADGTTHFVRCDWRPDEGESRIGITEARRRGPNYLREDLQRRLPSDPIRFILDVQVAEEGDPVDDPSRAWPASRRRLDAGTLELTSLIDDPEADGEIVVFDAVRLTDGIEMSGDRVLAYRPSVYSESAARRSE